MDICISQVIQDLTDNPKVNPYSVYELQELIENKSEDFDEIERLCFSIVTDLYDDKSLIELQNNDNHILWYDYLQLQIYAFLKGKGDYIEKKSLLTASSAIITENFASEIFSRFGVDDKLIPLVASIILCVATQISTESWCNYFYDRKVKNNELMLNALKEMGKKDDSGKI